MLKAFHLANYIFVTLKFLCNTFWSMSQQVLQHNQRIVRGPPILVVKFKQSVLESFHSFIFDQMINIQVASINNNNINSKILLLPSEVGYKGDMHAF